VDALIAEFIRDSRRSRATAIDLHYLGPEDLLIGRLRAFGFRRRAATNGLRVAVNREAAAGVDLERPENWYFMRGDTDF
jgi:hypothetical protein